MFRPKSFADLDQKEKGLVDTIWPKLNVENLKKDKKILFNRINSLIAKINWEIIFKSYEIKFLEKDLKDKVLTEAEIEILQQKKQSVAEELQQLESDRTLLIELKAKSALLFQALKIASTNEAEDEAFYKTVYVNQVNSIIYTLNKLQAFTRDAKLRKVSGKKSLWSKIHQAYMIDLMAENNGIALESSLGGSLFDGLSFGSQWTGNLNTPLGFFWDAMSLQIADAYTPHSVVEARVLEYPVRQSILARLEAEQIFRLVKEGKLSGMRLIVYEYDRHPVPIYLLRKLPDLRHQKNLTKYENTYIFIKKDNTLTLYHVLNGEFHPLLIPEEAYEKRLKIPKNNTYLANRLKNIPLSYVDILLETPVSKKPLNIFNRNQINIPEESQENLSALTAKYIISSNENHKIGHQLKVKKDVFLTTMEEFEKEIGEDTDEYKKHQSQWQKYQTSKAKSRNWIKSIVKLNKANKLVPDYEKSIHDALHEKHLKALETLKDLESFDLDLEKNEIKQILAKRESSSPTPPGSRSISQRSLTPGRMLSITKLNLDRSRTPTPASPLAHSFAGFAAGDKSKKITKHSSSTVDFTREKSFSPLPIKDKKEKKEKDKKIVKPVPTRPTKSPTSDSESSSLVSPQTSPMSGKVLKGGGIFQKPFSFSPAKRSISSPSTEEESADDQKKDTPPETKPSQKPR